MVLVILAALWAVVLLPPLLRSRTERSNDSIGDFNYRLDVLGRTNGALREEEMRSSSRSDWAAKRRRDVVRVLLIVVGVTGLLALATNMTLLWGLHLVADVALLGFFGLWAWARSAQAERAAKVRHLPALRSEPARAELPLRRAASS